MVNFGSSLVATIVNGRWLAAIASGFVLFAALVLANTLSADAAVGGQVDDGNIPTQEAIGTVASNGNPVWAVQTAGAGTEIVTCNDSFCRNTSISRIDDLDRPFGFDVTDDGRAVTVGIDRATGAPRVIICSDTSCNNVVSNTPAPALGQIFVRPNNSMIIVDDTTVTRCRNLDCTGNVRVKAHGVSSFRDVTLVDYLPVFLTDNAILRCNLALCQDAETSTPINVNADGIVIRPDGLPTLSTVRSLGDDVVVFELVNCLSANCTDVDVEQLDFATSGRRSFTLFDSGDPIVGTSGFIALSRETTLLASSEQRCTATPNGNNITLQLDGDVGDAAILRVNGRFVADLTGRDSFTTASGNDPIIRTWANDEFVDVPCIETAAAPTPTAGPTCTAFVLDGDRVFLDYAEIYALDGTIVVRKNGQWLATPERGISSAGSDVEFDFDIGLDDFDARASDTYIVRHRSLDRTVTDFACN